MVVAICIILMKKKMVLNDKLHINKEKFFFQFIGHDNFNLKEKDVTSYSFTF